MRSTLSCRLYWMAENARLGLRERTRFWPNLGRASLLLITTHEQSFIIIIDGDCDCVQILRLFSSFPSSWHRLLALGFLCSLELRCVFSACTLFALCAFAPSFASLFCLSLCSHLDLQTVSWTVQHLYWYAFVRENFALLLTFSVQFIQFLRFRDKQHKFSAHSSSPLLSLSLLGLPFSYFFAAR